MGPSLASQTADSALSVMLSLVVIALKVVADRTVLASDRLFYKAIANVAVYIALDLRRMQDFTN